MLEPSSGLGGHSETRASEIATVPTKGAVVHLSNLHIIIRDFCENTLKSVIFDFLIFSISDTQESFQIQNLQETGLETTAQTAAELLNIYSDDEYIRKIKKRLEEDTFAREQREKRRRKMLMEQLIAHEAQEVRKHMLKYITHAQLVQVFV